ncbi:MAG: phage holin family protein [Chloroflexi bacterium]|nr:phage holin family protein [Chloroflexota bacterium]
MDDRKDERSLGQLFGDLSRQLSTLVRQEIDLARTEVTGKAGAMSRDAAFIGVGGALLYAALLAVLAAVTLLLVDAGLTPWLAALIVGIAVAVIGGALIARGRSGLSRTELTPRRTIETLKDDADWAKERIS